MTVKVAHDTMLAEFVERHRSLYDSAAIDAALRKLIRAVPPTLSTDVVVDVLRRSRAVFFETHVEVVSGHHTGVYLRFDSIARVPELLTILAQDMGNWISRTYRNQPLTGIMTTSSAAARLAETVAAQLAAQHHLRVVCTPYSYETGRIGTEIGDGLLHPGDRFLALNDVTTRGACVSKLGKVITDRGALLAGMMVFARRDSGQFPLMEELTRAHPFYYTADLDMPQWEPAECPLCKRGQPLLSWREMPEL